MGFELSAEGELYYRLAEGEYVDADAYDMLRNNEIEHVLSPSLKQSDANRLLVYDTANMTPSNLFFASHVFDLRQLVEVLLAATEAFVEAHDYMLNEESFAGSTYYFYLDDDLHARLVYTPVMGYKGCPGVRPFLLDIFVEMRYDTSINDMGALARIYQVLVRDDDDDFNPQRFKRILTSLLLGSGTAVAADAAGRDVISSGGRQREPGVSRQPDVHGGDGSEQEQREAAEGLVSLRTPQVQAKSADDASTQIADAGDDSSDRMLVPSARDLSAGILVPSGGIQRQAPEEEPNKKQGKEKRRGGLFKRKGDAEEQEEQPSKGKKGDAKKRGGGKGLLPLGKGRKKETDRPGQRTAQEAAGGQAGRRGQVQNMQGGGALDASRKIMPYAVLAVLTFGIYPLVYLFPMLRDVDTACGADGKSQKPDLVPYALLSVGTVGLYDVFLRYRMARRMSENASSYGLELKQGPVKTLLLDFVVPFVLNVLANVLFVMLVGRPFFTMIFTGLVGIVVMLVWMILLWIAPIMAMNGLMNDCNALCTAYNSKAGMA